MRCFVRPNQPPHLNVVPVHTPNQQPGQTPSACVAASMTHLLLLPSIPFIDADRRGLALASTSSVGVGRRGVVSVTISMLSPSSSCAHMASSRRCTVIHRQHMDLRGRQQTTRHAGRIRGRARLPQNGEERTPLVSKRGQCLRVQCHHESQVWQCRWHSRPEGGYSAPHHRPVGAGCALSFEQRWCAG